MKVLVISGFLGAGKTTFIQKLLEMSGESFVVLENDYGQLPVDSVILSQAQENTKGKVNIWEMTDNCVCCTGKADFAASILTIANTLSPEYLIVEPTGVGMLSNVLKNIKRIQYERISLLRPITVIDATCFDADFLHFGEIYRDQIINTDRIILSKTERLDGAELDRMTEELRKLNPTAELDAEHYSRKDESWFRGLLRDETGRAVLSDNRESPTLDLESLSFSNVYFNSLGVLTGLLEGVIRGKYGYIKRGKGCVRIQGGHVRFDVVGDQYTITGIIDPPSNHAVFIGMDLDKKAMQKALKVNTGHLRPNR